MIKLSERSPKVEIDGEKVLVYRLLNDGQKSQSFSIFHTLMLKHCNPEETWWTNLPKEPI